MTRVFNARVICESLDWQRIFPVGSKIGNRESVSAASRTDCIEIRGARQNNLKGIDIDLPLGKLTVVTGPSGSGKSSLAFETIYAEGQRRYVETFSPYMRQFLDRMDKPRVDDIRGIPPAIAVEQSNPVKTSRSTLGTTTMENRQPSSSRSGSLSRRKQSRGGFSISFNSKVICVFGLTIRSFAWTTSPKSNVSVRVFR